ncbi:MAG: phosphopantetheine-binding protein [bacterium]|nr:phosphopantetheine-binding protein [bacterium]
MEKKDIIKTYLKKEIIKDKDIDIKNDEPLITSGLIDSFNLVKLAVFLEKTFKVKINNSKVAVKSMNTINDIAKTVEESKK